MSLALSGIDVVRRIENRMAIDNPRVWELQSGAKMVKPSVYPASSWSNSNIQYAVNPDPNFVLDKKIYQRWYLEFKMTE